MSHRTNKTRRSPTILRQLRSNDGWCNEESTELTVSWQLKPQIWWLNLAAHREVGTRSRRLKGKLIEVLSCRRRSVAEHLEISTNAVVIRDHSVRWYKLVLIGLDAADSSILRHDRSHCGAVLKFDAGFYRYSCQRARDTSDTFNRIERSNGMNEGRHKSYRAGRFVDLLSSDLSPDRNCIDDRLG